MKVSIGSKIIEGPWGGGNLFVTNLSSYLKRKGHQVIYNLSEKDIDLIILTDPRSRKESTSTFNHLEINRYKKFVNKDVVVVQRINECDERKGTKNINSFYLKVSDSSDHVVFVSTWLRDIYVNLGMDIKKTSVLLAGANSDIFNHSNSETWEQGNKLKLVTHHWSSHVNKGFQTYELINEMLNKSEWKDKIEFTYIGNVSDEYDLNNTNIIQPLAGTELSKELKKHHVYVTGSINEPSGNHHIEAAQCGLPLLYLDSGGMPEYCDGYGLSFYDDFETKLKEMMKNYAVYKSKVFDYPNNSIKMCEDYYSLFIKLIKSKKYKSQIKRRISFLGYLFLLKQTYQKIFRDNLYFNFKIKAISFLKNIMGRNG